MTRLAGGLARGPGLVVLLGSLVAVGPMSIDLYLPALPQLADRFAVNQSQAQLTITACLIGLAVGQLVGGPVSDAMGRRLPLLVGVSGYAAASVGCALAGSAGVFTGMRWLQGFAGGFGVVIARAVVRDLYSGVELARFFSLLMLVNGLAPVLAPMLGGELLRFMPWPGLFGVLAGYGVLIGLLATFGLTETLPASARQGGGLLSTLRTMTGLLSDRRFLGYALTMGSGFAAMFCYIAGSPFVLQGIFGLSPRQFGLAFGVNALGVVVLGQVNRVLLRRFSPRRLLAAGLTFAVLGGVELLVASALGGGLASVFAGLFAVVASLGLITPNTTALALAGRPSVAGTASALLGLLQFLLGAVAAPLVGVFSTTSPVPLAAMMLGLTLAAVLSFALLTRGHAPSS